MKLPTVILPLLGADLASAQSIVCPPAAPTNVGLAAKDYRLESNGSTLAISGGGDVAVLYWAYTPLSIGPARRTKHGASGICTLSGDALAPASEKVLEGNPLEFQPC